jgi:hypothetical protein
LKLRRANVPHYGLGPHGSPKRLRGLMAGDHLKQRDTSGDDDHRGYKGSSVRRNGALAGGKLNANATSDTRRRSGAEGNGRGSPAPGVGKGRDVRGTPDSHLGTAGRGGAGRHGKADNFKGRATDMSESPSHSWFEKLGAD